MVWVCWLRVVPSPSFCVLVSFSHLSRLHFFASVPSYFATILVLFELSSLQEIFVYESRLYEVFQMSIICHMVANDFLAILRIQYFVHVLEIFMTMQPRCSLGTRPLPGITPVYPASVDSLGRSLVHASDLHNSTAVSPPSDLSNSRPSNGSLDSSTASDPVCSSLDLACPGALSPATPPFGLIRRYTWESMNTCCPRL